MALQGEARLPPMGDPDLERQHRGMLLGLERIEAAVESGAPWATIGRLLTDFADATVLHFCREEVAMEKSAFPGRHFHSHLHAAYLEFLIQVVHDHQNGLIDLRREIVDNLRGWFLIHLGTQDAALGEFLERSGYAAPDDSLSDGCFVEDAGTGDSARVGDRGGAAALSPTVS